jgi:hypothetical protein
LKPEQWGSLLVQENNQEGKACDKRRIIIIIIIIIGRKIRRIVILGHSVQLLIFLDISVLIQRSLSSDSDIIFTRTNKIIRYPHTQPSCMFKRYIAALRETSKQCQYRDSLQAGGPGIESR